MDDSDRISTYLDDCSYSTLRQLQAALRSEIVGSIRRKSVLTASLRDFCHEHRTTLEQLRSLAGIPGKRRLTTPNRGL